MDILASIGHLLRGYGLLSPVDYEELDVTGTVVVLTSSKTAKAFCAEIRFGDGPINFTVHAADPSSVFGIPAYDGNYEVFNYPAMNNFRAVKSGAANGKLRVTYYAKA